LEQAAIDQGLADGLHERPFIGTGHQQFADAADGLQKHLPPRNA